MFPPDYFPPTLKFVQGTGAFYVENGTLKYTNGTGRIYKISAAVDVSPDALPGLRLWLKADAGLYQDAAGTVPAVNAGDPVGRWSDQSASGNHATQSTVANKATLRTAAINGKPALQFDGVSDVLALNSRVSTARTIIAVVKYTNTTTEFLPLLGDPTYYYFHGAGAACGNSAANVLGANCASSQITGGAGYVNSVATAPASILRPTAFQVISLVTTDVVQFSSIAQDRNLSRFFAGYFAELIVYDNPLADADRRGVENYLNTKYAMF